MYVCIIDEKGEIKEQRNMKTERGAFLKAIAPCREDIIVAAGCIFTWYGVTPSGRLFQIYNGSLLIIISQAFLGRGRWSVADP
jgi:hypothetical protein